MLIHLVLNKLYTPNMNPVIRGIIIYLFLLLVFRIMGKRSLSETTMFDLLVLLIISEVTQQAMVNTDNSITAAAILISTLLGLDLILSLLKKPFKMFEKIVEGTPLIIVDHGKPLKDRMSKSNIDEEDIMQAARSNQGLERMEQVKYAVLEKDGTISIIPFEKTA
jgi:uncharacterized membrane protein YcaP (DUF421 family)